MKNVGWIGLLYSRGYWYLLLARVLGLLVGLLEAQLPFGGRIR